MRLLPFFLLMIVAFPSHARLGETRAQIEARYGKPTAKKARPFFDFPSTVYKFQGREVVVLFSKEGKSVAERIEFKGDREIGAEMVRRVCGTDKIREFVIPPSVMDHLRSSYPLYLQWRDEQGNVAVQLSEHIWVIAKEVIVAWEEADRQQELARKAKGRKSIDGF